MVSKCLFSLVNAIVLIATFLIFNACHADKALIDSICKDSQDYNFCSSTFNSHARSAEAGVHGLALIAISNTVAQIQDTLDRIPTIGTQQKGRLGKRRLRVCQSDYKNSLGKFRGAFSSTSRNAYWDTINLVRDGTNAVIDCHNIYRRNGPIATSPIAGDDIKVIKLSEIILIIINRLIITQ